MSVASQPPSTIRVQKLTQNYEVHENELSDGVDSVVQLLEACGGDAQLFEAAVAASTTISSATAKLYADQSDREFGQMMTTGAGLMKAMPAFFDAINTARDRADARSDREDAKVDAKTRSVRVDKKSWDNAIADVNRLNLELSEAHVRIAELGGDPVDHEDVIEQLREELAESGELHRKEREKSRGRIDRLKAKMAEADERLMSERELRAELLNTRESLQEGAEKTAQTSKRKKPTRAEKQRSTIKKGTATDTSLEA